MEEAGAAMAPRYQGWVAIGPAWWEMRERRVIASKDKTMSSTGNVAPCCVWDVLFSYRTLHWKEKFEARRFQVSVQGSMGKRRCGHRKIKVRSHDLMWSLFSNVAVSQKSLTEQKGNI